MKTNRETDKLLFGVFTKLVFWNTNCFLKPGLIKSKRKNEYPMKTLVLYRKYRGKVVLTNMNFTNAQFKTADSQLILL